MSSENNNCIVIAEIAQAHDGSLGTAHAYIDAVADAGADAVKFQTHIAAAESTPLEPWRVQFSKQDENRFDYWKRMEFTEEQWHGLKAHADERNLLFLSSPFSIEAVEMLKRVGVAGWKIASGEVNNDILLGAIADSAKPILISSGMSSMHELDQAVAKVRSQGQDPCLLQCCSMYPTPPEHIGLNMISTFRDRYNCKVGLSDHSGTIFAGLAAASLGIDLLEVHVTFSRQCFGPDVPASITIEELKQLVDGVRFIEKALANPSDKDKEAERLSNLRDLFTKSVVLREALPAGTILEQKHLTIKKPGTGIPANKLPDLIGRKLKHSLDTDSLLQESDLE